LTHIDTGFETERALAAQFHLPSDRYASGTRRLGFAQSALERVSAIPGVTAAAVSTGIPLASGAFSTVSVPGRPTRPNAPFAYITAVTSDYFRVFSIPVVGGMTFRSDADVDPHAVVISLATARAFFRGENPIGKRIATYGDSNWVVIGVVGDVRQERLDEEPPPNVYLPLRAAPSSYMKVSIRTATDPASVAPSLRRLMRDLDPGLPLDKLETMQVTIAESLQRQRFYASVLIVFAAMALVIATAGLYALASYNVTRRMHELGIRVALGAGQRQILTLVIGRGLRLVGVGCIVGLTGAFAATRVLRSLVYDVNTADPRIFAAVALLLGCVAIVATYLPGRRGAMADPLIALRNE
jgi:putative ABC transport system permease protein